MDELDGGLAELVEIWSAGAIFSPATAQALQILGLATRTLLLCREERGGDLRWRYVGAGIRAFGTSWANDAIGKPAAFGSPADYAVAIGAEYEASIHHAEPLHNHIVANLPDAARLEYRQTLLPWFAGDGRCALLIHTERC